MYMSLIWWLSDHLFQLVEIRQKDFVVGTR